MWENTKTIIALIILVIILILLSTSSYTIYYEGRIHISDFQKIAITVSEYSVGDIFKYIWNIPILYLPLIYLAWYLFWPRFWKTARRKED